jgi:aromatic ring-cleaving dioxygenase
MSGSGKSGDESGAPEIGATETGATETGAITDYHAHVYYDAASKATAAALRDTIAARFTVKLGRWHDDPVGPHPTGSYQIAFDPELFATLVPWLMLNRAGLTVLVHPNTGEDLADHRDRALWLGESRALDLSVL